MTEPTESATPEARQWRSSTVPPSFWRSVQAWDGATTTSTATGTAPPARIAPIWSNFIRRGGDCPASDPIATSCSTKPRCNPAPRFTTSSAWGGLPVRPEMPGAGHPPPPWTSGHPGMVEPLRQDHPLANAAAGHPAMPGPAFQHPGSMAMTASRFAPPQAGGFTSQRPGPQGGFRPGAPALAMRAAQPAPHGNTAAGKRQ